MGRKRVDLKLSLWGLVLMFACAWLLVVSTFVQFELPNPFGQSIKFIPQIPVVLFAGVFLGRKYGLAAVILYIVTGLFWAPVFGLGGGMRYIFEYGFGYILAYIPAVFFSTSILQSGFFIKNIAQAALVGVLSIHIIGIIYMLLIAGIKHEDFSFMYSWIAAQSGEKIIYDLVLTFAAILLVKYLRPLLRVY